LNSWIERARRPLAIDRRRNHVFYAREARLLRAGRPAHQDRAALAQGEALWFEGNFSAPGKTHKEVKSRKRLDLRSSKSEIEFPEAPDKIEVVPVLPCPTQAMGLPGPVPEPRVRRAGPLARTAFGGRDPPPAHPRYKHSRRKRLARRRAFARRGGIPHPRKVVEPVAKKKAEHRGAKKKAPGAAREAKPGAPRVLADLSDAEKDLVSRIDEGWRLETDSLGGNPVLRDPRGDVVIRPISANRSTIEALERRGLIVQGQGSEPLTISWRLKGE